MFDDKTDVATRRHIPFEGTPNFRDYGGYKTRDGRAIKWRQLFRSGELSKLTDNDQDQFGSLDIRIVFDFRRDDERLKDPSLLPESAMPEMVPLPINPGNAVDFVEIIAAGTMNSEQLAGFMCDVNKEFVFDQSEQYRKMFSCFLNLDEGGSLVHCAAGKDRTGFAAAMMLSALGVSRETIFADYMLTADYLSVDKEVARISQKYQWPGEPEVMRPMLEVRPDYLQSAFEIIDKEFPRVEDYLQEVLGMGEVERNWLQSRYLV
ncbi:MAG: tyrosine-protein phosphatase [Oceanicoccus sp.]|uniref:tyrosine-protein phosphatase n=1 Tax=Oceanicoccus sp. TaxID=2691044 RepID=UPI002617C58B|nr:tyrosine-protein phosphatase [Oceanicoccus sp.]MDG1773637.1 tyrosine-protein phosphatase [Oceanicoccus sp.]